LEERIGERFRRLRRYLDISGPEMAKAIGATKQTISAIETEDRSLTRELIQKICDVYSIDARYFFGQIENESDADIKKRGDNPGTSQMESLVKEMRNLKEHVQPMSSMDPIAERVMVNQELRELVQLVQFWDASMIRRVKDIAYGYLEGSQEDQAKKEKASGRESA
jgi:transcriptional regulator with XRE-family HTH domain